jgi:mannose-1-phosphate guanylyltransferase
MKTSTLPSLRSAIVLAGGEGRHIRHFVRQLRGVDLPKQYVPFIGTRSLLQHTLDRAKLLIPADRIYTVLAQNHLAFPEVRRQIGGMAPHTVVVQPTNNETGPGLLLPLRHLYKRHPDSTVAVFPSDHFILQEDLFADYVQQAFETVEAYPEKIVFLGAEPSDPEREYGYILPESQIPTSNVQIIKAFVEEPETNLAARLISLGALWNTMVMIFKPQTFFHLIKQAAPELYCSFLRVAQAIGTPVESIALAKEYREMKPIDLCKDMIPLCDLYSQNQFSVIPMKGVFWSDWGCATRVLSVLEKLNYVNRVHPAPIFNDGKNQITFEPTHAQLASSL